MSDLIMTISDDEDDQQQLQPQSLSAEEKLAQRQQSNRLSQPTATTGKKTKSKPALSLSQQIAAAEQGGSDGEMDGGEEESDEEEFEMATTFTTAPTKQQKKKPAPAKQPKGKAQKRKAAEAQMDDDEDNDEDEEDLPLSGSGFSFDVDASVDEPTGSILAPSKAFQPYNLNTGTTLQHKIEKQLAAKKAKKGGAKKGEESDVSSSEDDVDSEGSDSDDDGDHVSGSPSADGDAADQVDSDVDMHEYNNKEDVVTRKGSAQGGKLIHAKPLPKPKQAIQDFASLKLSRPLLRAISDIGWSAPTPVQSASILPAVAGKDLLVNAVTGSGKTGAFMLPILERLLYRPKRVALSRVLVLLPTRELAAQCHEVSQHLAKYTDIRICLVVGGLSEKVQEQELRAKPDIILATPGRLIDHLRNTQNVHLEDIEILVLDEADRLLENGFAEELREIIKETPKGRQTLLFSATLTETVIDLVNLSLNEPIRVKIDAYESIVDNLQQEFIRIRDTKNSKDGDREREAIILALVKRSFKNKTIVFMQSKLQCHRMSIIFGLAGLKAAELQGNMTQTQRLESLEAFREGRVDFLLCTDLAARGLDIAGVETVLNMSMPKELRQYIHRVGRTARAGRSGRAVTLVGEGQRGALKELVKKARDVVHSRVIPPEVISKYRGVINEMESDIRGVFDQEAEEKAIRVSEMEANKALNTIKFQDDILNRPAKTWFQTPAEKQKAKEAGGKLFEDQPEEPKLSKKELAKLEEKLRRKEEKKKDSLRGLSRDKKRRKLMRMEDEKMAKEAMREAKKHAADSLRAQSLPEVDLPMTLAQQEKMQRALGHKAKKERRAEKAAELGIDDVKSKRRELQAQQMLKADKKAGKAKYNDASMESADKPRKETTISGSIFRFKQSQGSGDDRYKLPSRKYKEEKAARAKGEASAEAGPSTKKKGKKPSGSFKSKNRYNRRK